MSDTVQSRISPKLKKDAERVLGAMGLKTSDAIRLFLQQTVNVGGLPFRPTAPQPNATTKAALFDAENSDSLSSYDNFNEIRKELDL